MKLEEHWTRGRVSMKPDDRIKVDAVLYFDQRIHDSGRFSIFHSKVWKRLSSIT